MLVDLCRVRGWPVRVRHDAEDPAEGSSAEVVANQMAEVGIETELLAGDGFCNCDQAGEDLDCDYMYLNASGACECSWQHHSYAADCSDDLTVNAAGVFNGDPNYPMYLYCTIPEVFSYYEGYWSADIGQIVYYAKHQGTSYQTYGQAFAYSELWGYDSTTQCSSPMTPSSTIASCRLDNVNFTRPFTEIMVRLGDAGTSDSQLLGIRVCYEP